MVGATLCLRSSLPLWKYCCSCSIAPAWWVYPLSKLGLEGLICGDVVILVDLYRSFMTSENSFVHFFLLYELDEAIVDHHDRLFIVSFQPFFHFFFQLFVAWVVSLTHLSGEGVISASWIMLSCSCTTSVRNYKRLGLGWVSKSSGLKACNESGKRPLNCGVLGSSYHCESLGARSWMPVGELLIDK